MRHTRLLTSTDSLLSRWLGVADTQGRGTLQFRYCRETKAAAATTTTKQTIYQLLQLYHNTNAPKAFDGAFQFAPTPCSGHIIWLVYF